MCVCVCMHGKALSIVYWPNVDSSPLATRSQCSVILILICVMT